MNCARSVIELLVRFWPYSIDALQPEEAVVNGVRPIFVDDKNVCLISPLNHFGTNFQKQGDLETTFLANDQGEAIEFGADQCKALRLTIPF